MNINKKNKNKYYNCENESFKESLLKFMGQTITIFTVSGGISGDGFTGVLLKVSNDHIILLTEIQSPPKISFEDSFSDNEKGDTSLGTITNIPINKIAGFSHNII